MRFTFLQKRKILARGVQLDAIGETVNVFRRIKVGPFGLVARETDKTYRERITAELEQNYLDKEE